MRMSATSRAAQGAKRRSRDTRDNDEDAEDDEVEAQTGTRTSTTIDLGGGPALPCKTKLGRERRSRKHRRVENDVKVNKMKIKSRAREWREDATQKHKKTRNTKKTENRKRAKTQNTLSQAAPRRDLI